MDKNSWTCKHVPQKISEIIGNKNPISIMNNWMVNNNFEIPIIVSGPHGVGKSLTSKILLKEYGYNIQIINSHMIKNSKLLKDQINFNNIITDEKIAIIIDDSDTITLASDKQILLQFLKDNEIKKKYPIIFISNDKHSKLLTDIKKNATHVHFTYPNINELKVYMNKICIKENLNISESIQDLVIKYSQFDIRRLIMLLQDLQFTFNDKSINYNEWNEYLSSSQKKFKDIGLFDATYLLLNNYNNINKCLQLYETEKVLLPLMIFENYHKNILVRSINKPISVMKEITNSISLGDVIETNIYSDQNWYLQNIHGFYTCVDTCYTLNKYKCLNEQPNNLEFSSDLNKTSLKNINKKNINIIQSYLPNKNLIDLLNLNKIIINCINNNNVKYLKLLAKEYKLSWKIIEVIIKIDKTLEKITVPTKIKKIFQ